MKMKKILSVLLSLAMITSIFIMPVKAEQNPTLTSANYPKGVTIYSDNKLYWIAPTAAGLTDTKLYKLTGDDWGTGTSVASGVAIDDTSAVYKLEFVFGGYSSEYIIQKSDIAPAGNQQTYGFVWGGSPKYDAVVVDSENKNNHSLLLQNYKAADNSFWVEFLGNGNVIPNDLATTGTQYQIDFDYKSSTNFCLWANGSQQWNAGQATSNWTHYTKVINWNDGVKDKTHEFSFDLGWLRNVEVDNLELHLLDGGNKTGNNLVPFDGTFESFYYTSAHDITNVQLSQTENSATVTWDKSQNVKGTRVYDQDNMLIAEFGANTSIKFDNLAQNEVKTYKIVGVYQGGYESQAETVLVYPKGTITKAHYPTGVIVKNSKIYWIAPKASGVTKTNLYKLTNGRWGTVSEEVTSPAAIDDEEALYKLEFVYGDFTVEYIIQKNDSTTKGEAVPYGYVWGTSPKYRGVITDDTGNHSLLLQNYEANDNRFWMEFLGNGAIIPNDLATTGTKYQIDFDYKSSTKFVLWLNGTMHDAAGEKTSSWTHFTKVIDWNDGTNNKTNEFSFNLSWYRNVEVDNLELHLLDANGKVTGNNLMPFDGTFEAVPASGLSNVQVEPSVTGATISWTQNSDVLATRIYDEAGNFIAEIADTEYVVNDLQSGENRTYKIASVFAGGYESAPVTVTDICLADKLASEYYPSGVMVKNSKIYWIAPKASGVTKTNLYKLTNGNWGTVSEGVTSPATISDENAVYKLEFVYDGYSSEYIIQKNNSASESEEVSYGYSWGVSPYYRSVITDDTGNHSLLLQNYMTQNNGLWMQFTENANTIPNDLATTGTKYQVDFDYKVPGSYLPVYLNGVNNTCAVTQRNTWTHYSKIITWDTTDNERIRDFSFDLGWNPNLQVDNLELYLLDSDGNKTGSNLLTFDGTFETAASCGEVTNAKSTETLQKLTFSWTKGANSVGTRIYNSDGILIAELGSATSIPIAKPETVGEYTMRSISAGGLETEGVTVTPENETEIAGYINEISGLIEECKAQSISTDYEDAALAIIEYFYNQLGSGDKEAREEIMTSLEAIYNQTVSDLEAYLDGSKVSQSVPKYKIGGLKVQNGSFIGTVSQNGTEYERPVFLNGTLAINCAEEDMKLFEKIGFNQIYAEISMKDILREATPADDWIIARQINDSTVFEKASNEYVSGSSSLKISASNNGWANNKLSYIKQIVNVEPNTKYLYSYRVKGAKPGVLWFSLKGLSRISGAYQMISDGSYWDDAWHEISGEYTTGEDETNLTLAFVNEANVAGVYIDDVSVKKAGTDSNLVSNPSFETASNNEFAVDYDTINKLYAFLANAEKYNLNVDLMLAIHNTPEFLVAEYPELDYKGFGFYQSANFDPTLPKSKEIIELFVDTVLQGAVDYTSLTSICLANEFSYIPNFAASAHEAEWQTWIKEKYSNNISSLNAVYGTSYASFSECTLTSNLGGRSAGKGFWNTTPQYKDYQDFSDELVTSWHAWLAGVVKENLPNVLVHSKIVPTFALTDHKEGTTTHPRQQIYNSANFEKLSAAIDLNGYDHALVDSDGNAFEIADLWNDYLKSANNVPNVNSENHIVAGTETQNSQTAYAALWQGATHGLGLSSSWIWNKNYYTANDKGYYDNLLNLKPEHLWQMSRFSFDFSRLCYEVSAIQNDEARVGVLYSSTSRIYSLKHMSAVVAAYRCCEYLGEKVRIITDANPDMTGLDVVIVPEAECVPDSVINALNSSSAKVIKLGNASLTKDDFAKARISNGYTKQDAVVINTAFDEDNSITVPTDTEIISALKDNLTANSVVVETTNGDVPVGVSWNVADYNGKKLISICNYTARPIQIRLSGEELVWKDRITDEIIEADGFVIYPSTPLLLEEQKDVNICQMSGAASNNVSKGGCYDIIVNDMLQQANTYKAFYKDGVLIDVEELENNAQISVPDDDTTNEIGIFVWDDCMKPLTDALRFNY